MSRAQAVVYGVISGLAVGLLAGLAVVNLENLREAAEENGPPPGSTVAHGETYEGDGEQESRLVQSEAERLVYVRTVAPSAQYAEGLGAGPFRLRTGTGYTLVLPAREQPYSLAELTLLAPDTLLREADAIFIEELRNTPFEVPHVPGIDAGKAPINWYEATSQAFAVFLPVKSVGVMGDGRTYEYVVALRAVQTLDFMTAQWAHLPHSLLGKVSNRIINEVRGINRVVYDISGKPPATIEWE